MLFKIIIIINPTQQPQKQKKPLIMEKEKKDLNKENTQKKKHNKEKKTINKDKKGIETKECKYIYLKRTQKIEKYHIEENKRINNLKKDK